MKEAFLISLKLATFTTFLLTFISLLICPLLVFKEFKGRSFIVGLITIPLVIPPTVLGFYLLLLFSPESSVGNLIKEFLGKSPLFTFEGILIASVIYSLPLAILPTLSAMEKVKKEFIETAYIFGYSRLETYLKVIVPLSLNGIISSAIMVFAHTLGEFGVILMVGGNIPGETQTLSVFIYDSVQALDYKSAHKASLILILVALVIANLLFLSNKRSRKYS